MGERCLLKAFAIIIHSIVPHAADVEHYFSSLGRVQSVKRCNLSVQTFEFLSKLRASYANFLHKMDQEPHAHLCGPRTLADRLETRCADSIQGTSLNTVSLLAVFNPVLKVFRSLSIPHAISLVVMAGWINAAQVICHHSRDCHHHDGGAPTRPRKSPTPIVH
ncbi:hypothetical protein EDB19DRAFT_1194990 [Suillus lakei]|nr:hypothetical protein EDB19DRAFT_1194990 [Suillus lakei]